MNVRKVLQGLAVCAISSLFVAGVAQAQNAQVRDGFWISGGLGYGMLGCEDCGDREGGVSGGFSLGGTVSPRFLLGIGASGWTKSEGGATLTVGLVDARIRFYPRAKSWSRWYERSMGPSSEAISWLVVRVDNSSGWGVVVQRTSEGDVLC